MIIQQKESAKQTGQFCSQNKAIRSKVHASKMWYLKKKKKNIQQSVHLPWIEQTRAHLGKLSHLQHNSLRSTTRRLQRGARGKETPRAEMRTEKNKTQTKIRWHLAKPERSSAAGPVGVPGLLHCFAPVVSSAVLGSGLVLNWCVVLYWNDGCCSGQLRNVF